MDTPRLSLDRWKLDTHDAKSKCTLLQFSSLASRIYRLGVDYYEILLILRTDMRFSNIALELSTSYLDFRKLFKYNRFCYRFKKNRQIFKNLS